MKKLSLIKPVVVLSVLCLVVSVALAFTNSLTADIIYEKENAAAIAARKELLPDAGEFEVLTDTFDGVKDVAVADTGETVITGVGTGYGGEVPVMVAIGADGSIVAVKVLEIAETPGIGDQIITDPNFQSQFAGMAAEPFSAADVDTISGATISSTAAIDAINNAIAAYGQIK